MAGISRDNPGREVADRDSAARPSRADPLRDARAVAEYLADMTSQMESMAKAAGLDLLSYLLAMARVEADAVSRAPETRRQHG